MRRAEAHHTAQRNAGAALLLIDLLQTFRGEEGRALLAQARPIAAAVRGLRASARRARVPIIYVNDHLGLWRGNQDELVARARRGAGRDFVSQLRPGRRDLFVLKPSRSGFFQTPLESLLNTLEVRRLVLAGLATDVCVLATALDAVMRKWRCHVPRDCAASLTPDRHARALALLEATRDADTRPAASVRW